jgi:hypothetical protein
MTERTITEQELKNILIMSIGIDYAAFNTVLNKAFPPIFKPKEGEVICVSDFKDFKNSKIRVFKHMNVNNGRYECFGGGNIDGTGNVNYEYAKPQTPTQKGE